MFHSTRCPDNITDFFSSSTLPHESLYRISQKYYIFFTISTLSHVSIYRKFRKYYCFLFTQCIFTCVLSLDVQRILQFSLHSIHFHIFPSIGCIKNFTFFYSVHFHMCPPVFLKDVRKCYSFISTEYTFTCALIVKFKISHQYYSSDNTQYIPTDEPLIVFRMSRLLYFLFTQYTSTCAPLLGCPYNSLQSVHFHMC